MQRSLVLACASFVASPLLALQVSVVNWVPSHCGQASGALQAAATGGVPPYAWLWSNGATTEIITGLVAGTYTVTVTDAVGTVAMDDGEVWTSQLWVGGQVRPDLAHCTGSYPTVDLSLYRQTDFGVYIWGQPPFTITGPASVVSSNVLPCAGGSICDVLPNLVRVEMDVPPGSQQTIYWEDANGCPGSSHVTMSTEAVWPVVSIYNVQGTCSGGNNGSFAYTVTPIVYQDLTLRIFRPNGSLMSSVPIGTGISGAYGQLSPGLYVLKVVAEVDGPFGDELCFDLTSVMIDDLGNTCGHVTGPVFIDANANCAWSFNENRIPQAIVEFTPGPYYTTTSSIGQFGVNLPLGTYDYTVIHPGAQQDCDGPITVSSGTLNTPIGCSSLFPLDAEVSGCYSPARPGFEHFYSLTLRNNTAANAGNSTLTFEFDPALTFLSASPAPASVVGNIITWTMSGIGAYASSNRLIYFQVPPDIGLIGTALTSTATVTTTNADAVPANNVWVAQQIVTASYDPNDKQARTSTGGSTVYLLDADEWIDYTIRFQNTGTDTAFTVVITDTLPITLDPASIRVSGASHSFNWALTGSGIVTFNFPGILLPDSNINEPRSHGFVGFRIRPRLPIAPGTTIENIANIYFDYNPPVITEPSVLVAEFSTGVGERHSSSTSILPNPGNQWFQVVRKGQFTVRVLDAIGREAIQPAIGSEKLTVLTDRLLPGLYTVLVSSQEGGAEALRWIKSY